MSVRTQDKRHWIQVELISELNKTGAMHVDLNMVDQILFNRNSDETVTELQFVYAGLMKPVGLKGTQAQFFYDEWNKFIQLNATMPKSEPGVLIMPDGVGLGSLRK